VSVIYFAVETCEENLTHWATAPREGGQIKLVCEDGPPPNGLCIHQATLTLPLCSVCLTLSDTLEPA
jgi:hypothetical protein